MLKLFFAESEEIARVGLTTLFGSQPDFEIVGSSSTGAEAFEAIVKTQPHVAITAIRLSDFNGIDLISRLKGTVPCVRTVVFSSLADDEVIFAALQAGADAYVMKGSTLHLLALAIKSVASGAIWLDPVVHKRVITNAVNKRSDQEHHQHHHRQAKDDTAGLSQREYQILALICDGMDNHSIAERLSIHDETVKTHVRHILEKLQVSGRTQAAVKALKLGIL